MTIDATVGGVSSDSYIDVATADTYHTLRLHNTEWAAASTSDKEVALKWATRILEGQCWTGTKADIVTPQALQWPRIEVEDPDENVLASTTIPVFLQYATAELAWQLLIADRTAESEYYNRSAVAIQGIGSMAFSGNVNRMTLPQSVLGMIGWYTVNGGMLV